MKGENLTTNGSVRARLSSAQLRERIGRLRRREPILWNGIRLGTGEIVGLGIATLLVLIAVVSYFNYLAPARRNLANLESENARMRNELRTATDDVVRGQNTQASVTEILQSITDFEAEHLPAQSEGRNSVIADLNNLIRRNSLRISGAANFTPLETISVTSPRTRSAGGAMESVFPGIGITLTVEGQYGNLRRFIRDIEASRQFVVIGGIELEGVTAETGANAVSLRLNMAAYFRRDNFGVETN